MDLSELQRHVEFRHAEKLLEAARQSPTGNVIVAIGHFGNFELYARFGQFVPGFKSATTYRGLRQPSLNRLMQSLRERSGCLFFERRNEVAELKHALAEGNLLLGLLSDQHAGRSGVPVPFFGRICSTSSAPAVFALRYKVPLLTGFCYRVGLAKWIIEPGETIPTHADGETRDVAEIMADVNRAFEAAIRREPSNWFWVHNRWKDVNGAKPSRKKPGPPAARHET